MVIHGNTTSNHGNAIVNHGGAMFPMPDHGIATDDHGRPRTPIAFPWVPMVWSRVTIGGRGIAMVDRGIPRMIMGDHGRPWDCHGLPRAVMASPRVSTGGVAMGDHRLPYHVILTKTGPRCIRGVPPGICYDNHGMPWFAKGHFMTMAMACHGTPRHVPWRTMAMSWQYHGT